MGNSCYECSDLHCDMDLSFGHHAKQQTHEASGAHQAGLSFGHEPVLESQPTDIPLTHNFGGRQPYLNRGHPALQMFSSSSHRHKADVLRVQEDRRQAEIDRRQAEEEELQRDLGQVWRDVGDVFYQDFLHWSAMATAGYDSETLEIELLTFLHKAASILKDLRDLPGHMDPHRLREHYQDALEAVRQQVILMEHDQTGWLQPVVN